MSSLTDTALRGLDRFGLEHKRIELVRHNENATFYVDLASDDTPIGLRLHTRAPGTGFDPDAYTPRALRSTLEWMEALAQNTEITVQRPMRSKDGELTVEVEDHNGEPVLCSVLEWIDGTALDQDHPQAEAHIQAFGAVVAKLHQHSVSWSPPEGFCRPSYGGEFMSGVISRIEQGLKADLFDEVDFDQIKLAVDRITSQIDSAKNIPSDWGLVHADLGGGNILVHGDEIRPIDYTLCSYAPYLFEVGAATVSLQRRWRQSFLAGYQTSRPLGSQELAQMEAGAIQGFLAAVSYHVSNPSAYEWITRRVPQVAQGSCIKLINGQRLLFDM